VEAEVGQRRLLVILLGIVRCPGAAVGSDWDLRRHCLLCGATDARSGHSASPRRAAERHPAPGHRTRLYVGIGGNRLGLGGAFALTRVMKTLLFRVSTTDAATFAGAAALFLRAALAASYIPARRATRIDPMAALPAW
jgi:hypothetical protein